MDKPNPCIFFARNLFLWYSEIWIHCIGRSKVFEDLFRWKNPRLSGISKVDLPKIGDSVRILGDKNNTSHQVVLVTCGGLKIFLKGITGDYAPEMLIKIETEKMNKIMIPI